MYKIFNMDEINFTMTNDDSVGLYDNKTNDIFHSVTGAKKESYDKFIKATGFEKFCAQKNSVKILDICFGIGYNTKSAIYYATKNNYNISIKIEALEISKKIAFLSPFVKDAFNCPDLNIYLLSYFIIEFDDFLPYIRDFFIKEYKIISEYFDPSICLLFENYVQSMGIYSSLNKLYAFLHNIYYHNISNSMEKSLKLTDILNIDFNIKFGDARQTIKCTNCSFDFVFLDAFTPHIQPLLWTNEFLNTVKEKMSVDGILSTYSNAVPIRKTLLDLGFNIGRILINDKQFGTVASCDNNKELNLLTDFDKGLLETKAGIPYHDNEALNLSSEQILKNRDEELKISNKMSSSKYRKLYENNKKI